jgi:hypothetical protein
MFVKLICALVLATAALGARADVEPMQLVGEARLQVLFWSIYDSRLFTADGTYESGERPVRLEIQYLRDIDADDLVARTAQEWEQQGIRHERRAQWLEAMAELWPDIRENDTLALELDETNRSVFFHNGRELGTVEDPDFGQHFLDIWLSPDTSRPELRLALIGQQ